MLRGKQAACLTLCILVGGLTLLTTEVAQSAKPDNKTFTAETITRIQAMRGATISPDGRWVALVKEVPRKPQAIGDGPAYYELHVVDGAGKRVRPFVTGKVSIFGVQWTPDSRYISFLMRRGKDVFPALYVIPIDGGEARKIFSFESPIRGYSWHPDGKQIAFIATTKKAKAIEKAAKHGFDQQVYEEGAKLAHVWLVSVNLSGSKAKRKASKLPLKGSAVSLAFNPSGDRLAVVLAKSSHIDDTMMASRLYVVDLKGKVRGVLARDGKMSQYRWAPDGKHLAVIVAADINDPRAGRLTVMDTSGKEVKPLLPNLKSHLWAVGWRDPQTVLFISAEGLQTRLGEVTLKGAKRTVVAAGKEVFRRFTTDKTGQHMALVGSHPQHPSEAFLLNLKTSKVKRLTDTNPWLAKMRFARQEAVRYKARDGLVLEGTLVSPLKRKAGKRVPLILMVHGGPESHVPNGWLNYYSQPSQVFAAQGYAVFFPNYRGSTGRGVAFSKKGQADYAGAEFDDLVDAITHFDKVGLVDPKRVGITGGSYGGYASAWAATKLTKHFKASVMFVGVSELISKFGTTDIPREMFLVHARSWPWQKWKFYQERSPVTYVEQARTPLLILHGKKDPRVHPSQSLIMYRYLKTYGKVPVRLVYYPHEGHGNRRAAARYDYTLRLLRWMNHYVTGSGKGMPPHALDYGLTKKKKKGAKKKR